MSTLAFVCGARHGRRRPFRSGWSDRSDVGLILTPACYKHRHWNVFRIETVRTVRTGSRSAPGILAHMRVYGRFFRSGWQKPKLFAPRPRDSRNRRRPGDQSAGQQSTNPTGPRWCKAHSVLDIPPSHGGNGLR